MANDLKMEVILQAIDRATRPIRAITQGSIGLGRALKESRDQLKTLQAQQADIRSWTILRNTSAKTQTELQDARARVKELGSQMAASGVPTRQMANEMQAAIRAATELKRQHQEQQTQLQGLRTRLSAAGISTKTLSQHSRDLKARIQEANDAISTQTRRMQALVMQQKRLAAARGQFDRAQQVAGGMAAGGAAGLGSAYALSRPLKGLVDAFAPAEDAATQLKVSMMDSTGTAPEDFKKIADLATGLGDRLPGTTADFQNMMTMLRRQGISAQSILGGTGEAAAYLGVQLQMPVDAAAEFAAKMQDATRTSENDMMALMDTIQRGFYNGVDPTNMLQGFSKISPAMDIIHKSGLEAANAFAPLLVMMDQTGMAGESAGNAFRKVFQSSMNTSKISKALDGLQKAKGIKLDLNFTDGKGEFAGIENIFKQLDKLKGLTTEDRLGVIKDIYGDDAETLQVLNTLMSKGMAGYDEVAGKLKNQADLRTRVNEQLGTLTNTIEAAEGSWTNAMSEIGATIAPELKDLINGIGELAVSVKTWVGEHPALTAAIVKTVGGLALLLAVGGGLTVMLASFLGPFAMVRYGLTLLGIKSLGAVSALKGLGGAFMWTGKALLWLGRTLMMNPIGLAVTAIAAAAYLIYKYWDPIKAYFLGLWAEIKAGLQGGLRGIGALILNFSPLGLFYRIFAGVMSYFGVQLPGKFTEFGALLLQRMVAGLAGGLAAIQTYLLGMWAEIKASFNGGLAGIAALILNFSPLGLFYQVFAGVMRYFGVELPGKFTQFGAMLMQGMVTGITNGLAAVKTAITGAGDNTISWFKDKLGIHSPSRVFASLGGFTMAGLEQGLTQGQKGPLDAVTNIGKQLTAAGSGIELRPALDTNIAQGRHGPLDSVSSMVKELAAAGADGIGLNTSRPITMDNRPPLSASSQSSAAGGQPSAPIIIQVHAAPGMDEQQLARLVALHVDKIQHKSQVRGRSALSDQE
ncbi:phage tail tape measure protein [Pseudomonas vlassakiae]|uniref:phage tail tape measure protein n=1 Tax=Pseudomonas vlassakiae TaxID=485888 RepID=UPI003D2B49A8